MSETRTEYRISGEDREGQRFVPCYSLKGCEASARELAAGTRLVAPWQNVRIQVRTVTESDWQDVQEEGQDG